MATIDIQLERLTVVKKNDLIGPDEPYVWMFGWAFGPDTLTRRQLVVECDPGPRNMGSVGKGESRAIPERAGRVVVEDGLLAAGAIWMAWEDGGRSAAGVANAYRAVCRRLNQALLARVDAHNLAAPTTEEMIAIGTVLVAEVATEYGTMTSWASVLTDSPVGFDHVIWRLPFPPENEARDIDSTLRGLLGGTEYHVTGRLQYTR